jgi:NAD(P)-dependent dehydrogenase (short-subunit alcohol dehydrogenase family)
MNRGAPVIVLIGRNRGIGFEICRQLASRGAQVVLTTRKPEAGHDAANKLAWQKRSARFHPLNVRGRIPALGTSWLAYIFARRSKSGVRTKMRRRKNPRSNVRARLSEFKNGPAEFFDQETLNGRAFLD